MFYNSLIFTNLMLILPEKPIFSEQKYFKNVWWFQKNPLPLHSLLRSKPPHKANEH